jgi:thiamine-phosphate pyrophosphorylase
LVKFNDFDFYFITDSELSKNDIFKDTANAINAGCKIVQYREKNKSKTDMIKEAKKLKNICEGKAIFLINDHIDIALETNADGVHIGQEDMYYENARKLLGENKIIGLTVHSLEEAIDAEKIGADYIGLAPIFKTGTKEDARDPIGTEIIRTIRRNINLPIVAVGGINKKNVKETIESGADSIVSIYAVLKSNDVYNEIKEFIDIIKRCKLK